MANQIFGRVIELTGLETLMSKKGRAYRRRDMVIERLNFDPRTAEPVYDRSDTPIFTFINDDCNQLEKVSEGELVAVAFDIVGGSYTCADGTSRYTTSVKPLKVTGTTVEDAYKRHVRELSRRAYVGRNKQK